MCAEPLKPLPLDLCRGHVYGESQPVAYIPVSVAADQAVEHSRNEGITRSHRANGKDVSAAAVLQSSVLLAKTSQSLRRDAVEPNGEDRMGHPKREPKKKNEEKKMRRDPRLV